MKKNKITIVYKINEKEVKIKLFDSFFVEKNKNNCKLIFENKEYELQEFFHKKEYGTSKMN